jgi:beta-lactamase superfamily II metal-dependent hydrolase
MSKRKNKNITVGIIVLVLLASLVFSIAFSGDSDNLFSFFGLRDENAQSLGKMSVDFIDVGQGECTLIVSGDNVILVDGGESGTADSVINFLRNKSISEIDCCIATHPHSDHIGSLYKVFSEFDVVDVIMPEIPENLIPTSKTYEKFMRSVSEHARNVYPAEPGESYEYGDIKIEILGPVGEYDNLNDYSVVSRIVYGKTSLVLTGDAEKPAEKDILNKDLICSADILKVGHHGSRTSTSDEWLYAVSPQFAVFSCGMNNDYGHPHKETIKRLEKNGIDYYRTDLLGTVSFESDGNVFTLRNTEY